MNEVIAMGKVRSDGAILQATPGITVSTNITPGNIYGSTAVGYTLHLPDRLVCDDNYIIQLTAQNYSENGPDYTLTTIAYRYQHTGGFEVLIWADRSQTGKGRATVYCDWHFIIYDNACKCNSKSTTRRKLRNSKK